MERIIIPQARMRYNHVFVFSKITSGNKTILTAEVRSRLENEYTNPAGIYFSIFKKIIIVLLVKYRVPKGKNEETFKVKLPFVKYDIGLAIMMRALGVKTDKDIIQTICQGNNSPQFSQCCLATLEEGFIIKSQEEALIHIARKANIQTFSEEEDPNGKIYLYIFFVFTKNVEFLLIMQLLLLIGIYFLIWDDLEKIF